MNQFMILYIYINIKSWIGSCPTLYLDYSPVNKAVHVHTRIHISVLPAHIRVYLDGLYVRYVYTNFAAVRNIVTHTVQSSKYISQQCTNPRRSAAVATNFCTVAQVLCVELAERHRSDAWSFEVYPIFWGNFCTSALHTLVGTYNFKRFLPFAWMVLI